MVMSKKKVKSEFDIKVENADIEQVERFKYLVSTVISGSKFEKYHRREGTAKSI